MNQKTPLVHTALKNSTYSLVGYLLPVLLTFFITPILVLKLGFKDYGLMIFINVILGILGLLDFGINSYTSKNLSSYVDKQESSLLIANLLKNAKAFFLIIGSAGVVLISVSALIINVFMPHRLLDAPNFLLLLLFSAITFFISTQTNIHRLIPNALERFDVGTKLNLATLLITNIVSLIVVLCGGKLVALFFSQSIISLIFYFINKYYAQKLIKIDYSGLRWSLAEAKSSFSWSAYSSLNELARTSLFSLDRLLIPFYWGTTSLAYYTLPGNITARIPGVSDNLSGVIFPISARLHGNNDTERLTLTYIRSTRLIMLASFTIMITVIANGYQILKYWINEDVALNSFHILIVLSVTNFVLSLMSPIATYLMTTNRMKFYTKISISMAFTNILFIFILLPKFGNIGASIAYLISTLPVFWAIYVLEKRYLHLEKFAYRWINIFAKFIFAGSIFYIVNHLAIKPFLDNLLTLVFLGPISALLFIFIYYILGFIHKEDTKDIYNFIENKIPQSWKRKRSV